MRGSYFAFWVILVCWWAVVGCSKGSSAGGDGGDDTDSATSASDTDTDADSDADGDADTDGDTDADTDADTDGDTDADTDADVDGDTDADTDTDTDVDGDADGDTDADADGDADTGTGTLGDGDGGPSTDDGTDATDTTSSTQADTETDTGDVGTGQGDSETVDSEITDTETGTGAGDTATSDSDIVDTGDGDGGPADTSSADTGPLDTASSDTSEPDTGTGTGDDATDDSSTPDTATQDSATADTATTDTATSDTGTGTGTSDTAMDTGTGTPADPCAGVDCAVGGACVAAVDTYTCNCEPGYENRIDGDATSSCREIPCYDQIGDGTCGVNAHCDGTTQDAVCVCDVGYLGDDPVTEGCLTCDNGWELQGENCILIPVPTPGDIAVTEIMIQTDGVTPENGQYIELYVAAPDRINVAGLTITVDGSDYVIPSVSEVYWTADTYYVLARNGDSGTNGGVTVDETFASMPTLATTTGAISLTYDSTVVDAVSWDDAYPHTSGSSLSLSPNAVAVGADPAALNDSVLSWCSSEFSSLTSGDLGTPGAENDPCTLENCALLEPYVSVISQGGTSDALYGQVLKTGVTDGTGDSGLITAQVGFGPGNSDASDAWRWFDAVFHADDGSNDQFTGTLTSGVVGVYDFAFRFSLDGGLSWLYCDQTWTTPYDGYDPDQAGTFSVTNADCVSGGTQCSDCIDNDGDGLVDGFDPTCLSAIDEYEGSFETGIPGDDNTGINKDHDCFVDGDSGGGNDLCYLNPCCDLFDPNEDDTGCHVDCDRYCGDGACGADETFALCPDDCEDGCGNDICDPDEDAEICPADCPAACGDRMCTHTETHASCEADCTSPSCGNDSCDIGFSPECTNFDDAECLDEDLSSFDAATCKSICPDYVPPGCDCWGCCTTCVDGVCDNIFTAPRVSVGCTKENFLDPTICFRCEQRKEDAVNCAVDCASVCGDGVCTEGETHASCDDDCAAGCGDASCGAGETAATCPEDCPAECGDGRCAAGEEDAANTALYCPGDCSLNCGDSVCDLFCGNGCDPENCELCPGMTVDDLPPHCTVNECPGGETPCFSTADCEDGYYCAVGCCIPNFPV